MSKPARSRRRFRVVARPQERARRARQLAACGAVVLLGAIAVAAARQAAGSLRGLRLHLPAASPAAPEPAVVAGVPEPFLSLAQAAADSVNGSAGEKAAALKGRFACVADVSIRRAWGDKAATLTPALRRAVAPVLRRGKAAGYLGDDGTVFDAPAGVYAPAGAGADVGDAPQSERRALAREWPALSAPGAMPAALSEMSYVSPEDGWTATLDDGTLVQWGRLEWTKEKLARLGEALQDARAKAPGAFSADLRWFGDGKVLLKPAGRALAAAGTHGGVR